MRGLHNLFLLFEIHEFTNGLDNFHLIGFTFAALIETAGTEPGFVNFLRSPGIDSQPGGLIRQPYLTYWPAKLQRLAESFLSSLNV
jgi:hypothetical protein